MANSAVQLTITVDTDALDGIANLLENHSKASASALVAGPLAEHGDVFSQLMMKFYMREGSSRLPMDPSGDLGSSIGYRLLEGKSIPTLEIGIIDGPDYAGAYLAGSAKTGKLDRAAIFNWLKTRKNIEAEDSRTENPDFIGKKLTAKQRTQKGRAATAAKTRTQRAELGEAEAKRRHIGAVWKKMSEQGIKEHNFVQKAFDSPNWQATLDHMTATLAEILETELVDAMLSAETLQKRDIAKTEFPRGAKGIIQVQARSTISGRFVKSKGLFKK